MTRQDIVTFLTVHRAELSRDYGVTRIGLAGSHARDEATEASDIDIVVEISSENKFRSFFNLLSYLEDSLGGKVDLAIESSLKPRVKERIIRDIVYV